MVGSFYTILILSSLINFRNVINKMISSGLSSPNPINQTITFQINLDDRQQTPIFLQLSTLNYQSQFHNFIIQHKLTRNQALELKQQIEKKLQQRVIQFLAIEKKKQLASIGQKYQYRFQDPNRIEQNRQNAVKVDKISSEVQTEQVPLFSYTNRTNSNPNIHPFQAYSASDQGNKVGNQQQSLLNKLQQSQKMESNKPSPRFYQPQADSIRDLEIAQPYIQEDLYPRQSPDMKSIFQSVSTLNNSPQYYKSSITQSPESKIHFSDQDGGSSSKKKLFLLQNYKKNRASPSKQMHSKSKQDFKLILHPNKKVDPQIFKRLYQAETESFHYKKMQQINTHEEIEYNQYLKQASSRKCMPIQHFQNLSTKVTESFKLKSYPERDLREAKQVEAAKLSFKQHLERKQEERKLRERLDKGNKQKDQKFELKGSHCEQKEIRKKMEMLKKQNQQYETKVRQRVNKQKRQNKYRDLSKHSSYSPASQSKYRSRVCPSCTPPKKSPTKIERNESSLKNIKKSPNKQYVSNILKEVYEQFSSQIKPSI